MPKHAPKVQHRDSLLCASSFISNSKHASLEGETCNTDAQNACMLAQAVRLEGF